MGEKEFWHLIEMSREYEEEQAEWLTEMLAGKGLEEVVDFKLVFQQMMSVSFTSRLWGAAYVLMGGCSDDTFDYFRGWLIGQGEEIFHKVLKEPEFLAEYIDENNLDEEGYPLNEELLNAGLDAYTLIQTGDIEWDDDAHDELLEALEKRGLEQMPDIEFDWEEEDLADMFPILWERFGENPLPIE